jgi:MerR family transcriptional regulator, copper efflux regulator
MVLLVSPLPGKGGREMGEGPGVRALRGSTAQGQRVPLTLEQAPGFKVTSMADDETGPEPGEQLLRAGEVARRTGLSKDALRFYERRGLLAPPRRLTNNYRVYPSETVERVLWIRRVLAAGFTIDELARILAERDRGGIPCRQVRTLGEAKLAEVEERLRELTALRDGLRELLADWDARLAAAPPGTRAGLLDSLRDDPPLPTRTLQEKRR